MTTGELRVKECHPKMTQDLGAVEKINRPRCINRGSGLDFLNLKRLEISS